MKMCIRDRAKGGTPVNRLPSFDSMCRLAVADKDVLTLLQKERFERAEADFKDLGADDSLDDKAWLGSLKTCLLYTSRCV